MNFIFVDAIKFGRQFGFNVNRFPMVNMCKPGFVLPQHIHCMRVDVYAFTQWKMCIMKNVIGKLKMKHSFFRVGGLL